MASSVSTDSGERTADRLATEGGVALVGFAGLVRRGTRVSSPPATSPPSAGGDQGTEPSGSSGPSEDPSDLDQARGRDVRHARAAAVISGSLRGGGMDRGVERQHGKRRADGGAPRDRRERAQRSVPRSGGWGPPVPRDVARGGDRALRCPGAGVRPAGRTVHESGSCGRAPRSFGDMLTPYVRREQVTPMPRSP